MGRDTRRFLASHALARFTREDHAYFRKNQKTTVLQSRNNVKHQIDTVHTRNKHTAKSMSYQGFSPFIIWGIYKPGVNQQAINCVLSH